MLPVGGHEAGQVSRGKGKKFFAWLWAGLCVLTIFLVVPFARAIQKFTTTHFGESFFIVLLLAAVAAVFLAVLYILIVRLKIRRFSQYLWLAVFAGLYFYHRPDSNRQSRPRPLTISNTAFSDACSFRAWRFSIPDSAVYAAAFFSARSVGILDEIIQWITPGRFWDLPDVVDERLRRRDSSCSPSETGLRPKLRGRARCPIRPDRLDFISRRPRRPRPVLVQHAGADGSAGRRKLPFLAPLERQEPMRETILKHRDPEIGTFYSRLTIASAAKDGPRTGRRLRTNPGRMERPEL